MLSDEVCINETVHPQGVYSVGALDRLMQQTVCAAQQQERNCISNKERSITQKNHLAKFVHLKTIAEFSQSTRLFRGLAMRGQEMAHSTFEFDDRSDDDAAASAADSGIGGGGGSLNGCDAHLKETDLCIRTRLRGD